MKRFLNLYKRFNWYAVVGVSTFLFDLLLVSILIRFGIPDYPAIVGSFLLAVSANFVISYKFVFKGTNQTMQRGYAFFIAIALVGLVVVGPGTIFLNQTLGWPFYLARMAVGGTTGVLNFLLNNFFNFKMGLR